MRKLILLAALALALPSSASAATPCTATGAKTIAQNSVARVFSVAGKGEVKRTYYGCLLTAKPTVIARDVSPKSDEDTHTRNSRFTLAGRYVAVFQEAFADFGAGEYGSGILVQGLKKGDRKFFSQNSQQSEIHALVVRDDGAAAWITGDSDIKGYREVDAVTATAKGAAPLDYATGVDASTLSIDADGVHWTRDAQPRAAQPIAPPAEPKGDPAAPGPESLDPAYGNSCGALRPARASLRSSSADAIVRAADGSYAVAGVDSEFGDAKGILVDRLTAAGAQDPGWNGGAAVDIKPPLPSGARDLTTGGVGTQPDGRIVVAFHYNTRDLTGEKVILARLTTAGKLDPTFGSGGFRADALPAATAARVADIAVEPDGSIAAAATTNDTPRSNGIVDFKGDRFTVVRWRPDGTLDSGFAGDGTATLATNALGRSAAAVVRVLPDGRIVAGGEAGEGFALARYLPDGTPDPAFGSGGATFASPPAAGGIKALDFLPDGRIVAAGDATSVYGLSLSLARYGADGAPDAGFGSGGSLIDPYSGGASGLIARPDGSLIVAGFSTLQGTSGRGLLRYDADGSRHTGFGVGGALVGFTSYGLTTHGIAPGPGGTVLAAQDVSDEFSIDSYAVDQPATGAAASGARACTLNVATKSLTQLLKKGKTAKYGKLRLSFFTIQPGPLRLKATAAVGGKTVTIGSATVTSGTYGVGIAEIKLSSKTAKALAKATSAPITVTAVGAQGAALTRSETLKR